MDPIVVTKSPSDLLLPIVFLSLLTTSIATAEHNFIKTTPFAEKSSALEQKISHLHFYFHDTISGSNPTAVPIVMPAASPSKSFFGQVTMIDDPLTVGPEPDSKCIGYAQGTYSSSSQTEVAYLMTMNLYFTEGKYNGSVLSVLGRNAVLHSVREMPVVGGSGMFRLARGYALAHTLMFNLTSLNAIVEYNVTVMHY